jgi:FkbM family methyltransferase
MLVWKRFLKPGTVFLDVGANVGLYTIWAIEHGARVIAIEPTPAFSALLRENLALNRYDAEIIEAALGPTTGRMLFTIDSGGRNHLVDGSSGDTAIEVDVLRLDDIAPGKDIRAMKIDVEGAERRVLLGGTELLRRVALIQVEWNEMCWYHYREPRQALAKFLRDADFLLCRATERGGLRQIETETVDFGSDVFAVSRSSDDALALIER